MNTSLKLWTALLCLSLITQNTPVEAATAYGTTDSYLSGLMILDCYGTEMTDTLESETPTATAGVAGNSEANTNQIGRIVNIDYAVRRPCFFSIQYKGDSNYEPAAGDKSLVLAMAIDHSENTEWVHGDDTTNAKHAGYDAGKLVCTTASLHNACAITHFITNANTLDQDETEDDNNFDGYLGINVSCATFYSKMTTWATDYADVTGVTAAPWLTGTSVTNILTGDGDVDTARDNADDKVPVICSAIMVSNGADDDNTKYKDPKNISIIGKHSNDGAKPTILNGERLFWQANFQEVNMYTAGDGTASSHARRVNIVVGQNDAPNITTVNTHSAYVVWAEKADADAATELAINKYASAFWVRKMPTNSDNTWSELQAFTDKVTTTNCDVLKNCPINIQDPDTNEQWVGIKVKTPNIPEIQAAFYAALSDGGAGGILDVYGGFTKVPAGTCTQGSSAYCALSLYHDTGTNETGNASLAQDSVSNLSNVCAINEANNALENAADCRLLGCLWPVYKCIVAVLLTGTANNSPAEVLSRPDSEAQAVTLSDPLIWNTMNGQGDGTATPTSGVQANILHVHTNESKDIYALIDSGNKNFPIALHRILSQNKTGMNKTGIRSDDVNNPGMQGYQVIKYPMTAMKADRAGSEACGAYAAAVDSRQVGCGRDYSILQLAGGISQQATVAIHEWSRNNISVKFPFQYDTEAVMHYSMHFTNPGNAWNTTAPDLEVAAHDWAIYAQSKNSDDGVLANGVQQAYKPRYVRLYETIKEYREQESGDQFITSVQLGLATSTLNDAAGWRTGGEIRTLTADASVAGANTGIALPTYSFNVGKAFGFHLKHPSDTILLKVNANMFFVNASLYDEDAPLYNDYGGVLGNCERPAWASVTEKNRLYTTQVGTTGNIDINKIDEQQCAALTSPKQATLCWKYDLTSKPLVRGKYEIWIQNTEADFFYKQDASEATFTIESYTNADTSFVDSDTVAIGSVAATTNPKYEWAFIDSTVNLKYNARSGEHQSDQRGFVLVFTSPLVTLETSVPVKEVVVDGGKYFTWLHTDCRYDNESISDLGTGVNVIDCIQRYGEGKYTVYVQVMGSENYVKQSATFTIKHASDYANTESDVIKKAEWRNSSLNDAGEAGSAQYLFDETSAYVCDTNAELGSKYKKRHNASNPELTMQLKLTAGNSFKAEDQCYIQIFNGATPVTTANGIAPTGFLDVRHNRLTKISATCQNGPTSNPQPRSLSNDQSTDNTNYHQIPAVVAEQLRPGYTVKLWVRNANAQWALQRDSATQLSLTGFTKQSPSGLITAVSAPEDEELEVNGDGNSRSYLITSSADASKPQDLVRVCMKPFDYGITSRNYFFSEYDDSMVFCDAGELDGGSLISHDIAFQNSSGEGMPPGSYKVLSNYKDTNGSSESVDACSRWSDEGITTTVAWKRNSGAAQIWSADGVSITGGSGADYKSTNEIGTGSQTDPEITKYSRLNTTWDRTDQVFSEVFRLNVRYPSPIIDSSDYWMYWSKKNDESCDCSTDYCTAMTKVELGYAGWPNVGKPNCQEHGKVYVTDFPVDGKYLLCITTVENLRGWAVQTTKDQIKTNITVHINPPPPTSSPVTAAPAKLSSSSTVVTVIAFALAMVGALLL